MNLNGLKIKTLLNFGVDFVGEKGFNIGRIKMIKCEFYKEELCKWEIIIIFY